MKHTIKYRCPSCPAMISVTFDDGDGAVYMDPIVECENPQCDHDGRLKPYGVQE